MHSALTRVASYLPLAAGEPSVIRWPHSHDPVGIAGPAQQAERPAAVAVPVLEVAARRTRIMGPDRAPGARAAGATRAVQEQRVEEHRVAGLHLEVHAIGMRADLFRAEIAPVHELPVR